MPAVRPRGGRRLAADDYCVSNAVGEDRSDFQAGGQSWSKADFGFTKATEGTGWTSKTFDSNWANLKAEGKHRGAYHFFHPAYSASTQARFFVDYVKAHGGFGPGDMFACDAEISVGADGLETADQPALARMHLPLQRVPVNLMPASVDSGVLGFCDEVAQLVGPACPVLLYTYLAFLPNVAGCTRYPLWIAAYSASAPSSVRPWSRWTMWQNAPTGGQGGGDRDYFNGPAAQLASWIKSYGGNTVPTQKVTLQLPTLSQGMSDPVNGMNFVRRAQLVVNGIGLWNGLDAAATAPVSGTFDAATTAAVKAVQQMFGLPQDGVVGPDTWTKLYAG